MIFLQGGEQGRLRGLVVRTASNRSSNAEARGAYFAPVRQTLLRFHTLHVTLGPAMLGELVSCTER